MEKKELSVFQTLVDVDVNGHTEKLKQGNTELTYLSWSWAWDAVKRLYPDASYVVEENENGLPFFEDADYGIMCKTSVTIKDQTLKMWLPVMDGTNRAMRRKPYTYTVKKYNPETQKKDLTEEKVVEAATMFDINKTIMRCLVKNLAMFGLGLYIYSGEDLPEGVKKEKEEAAAKEADALVDAAVKEMKEAKTSQEASLLWKKYTSLQTNVKFKEAVAEKQKEFAPKQQPQNEQTQQQAA